MKKKKITVILSAALIGATIFGILYLRQVSKHKDGLTEPDA